MSKQAKEFRECVIRCPNCDAIQNALVKHAFPFPIYIHRCTECNYIIMESEWVEIDCAKEVESE